MRLVNASASNQTKQKHQQQKIGKKKKKSKIESIMFYA